jgi:hypothetical protein
MPDSPVPTDNSERLALIQRLWRELKATGQNPERSKALMQRIRQETDAFRRSLDADDPTKF